MFGYDKFLIAEIGINHNGNFETAKILINVAQEAGASAVKFQYRNLSNTYQHTKEIGDEILSSEINRNYLSPNQIIELASYAHNKDLKVGISFFNKEDLIDFESKINNFDFFKIPSPEMSNIELINSIMKFKKLVFISTGAHTEVEIEKVFNNIIEDHWVPLHCVSNYPVYDLNSNLGYMNYLAHKWNKPKAYSSHDENWENCLVAIAMGAKIIERHITLDKKSSGIDHSSSSTREEFKKISHYLKNIEIISSGEGSRGLNQGELINRQNLGRTYYAKRNIEIGEKFDLNDFDYLSPQTGLSKTEVDEYIGKSILQMCKVNNPITKSHFSPVLQISDTTLSKCNELKISLPVRLHDYEEIASKFRVKNFELHISKNEVPILDTFRPVSTEHEFTIHFPDYLSASSILDPFSNIEEDAKKSRDVINKVKLFAAKLSKFQGNKIILVASFTSQVKTSEAFYKLCSEIQEEFNNSGLILSFQWMPPFAWYFGGSYRINKFNNIDAIEYIKKNKLNICLDTSHLLMGSKFYGFDPRKILLEIENNVVHFHISDSVGIDGEGFEIGSGDPENLEFLQEVLKYPQCKVIETWQGHLNLHRGFAISLETIGKWVM